MPKRLPTQPLPPELGDYELDWDAIQAIPERLMQKPDFYEAWELWVAHRAIKQKNPLSKRAARQQLANLAKHCDHADPVEVIDRSMNAKNGGWTGLFPESVQSYQGSQGSSRVAGLSL